MVVPRILALAAAFTVAVSARKSELLSKVGKNTIHTSLFSSFFASPSFPHPPN